MEIVVNGAPKSVAALTITELLMELSIPTNGVAVAVNESVVRKADHASHRLSNADKVEIIRAVQGG